MTREEAINILNYEIDKMSDNRGSDYSGVIALGMAIQALKQEPCTDAISRQAVLDEINRIGVKGFETYNDYSQLYDFVDTLSPVKPQPCKDAISREAVLQAVSEGCFELRGVYGRCEELINELPSVNPQEPKTGHWIAQDIHNCHTDFKCSECGYIHNFTHLYGEPTADYTYCPNCGAKMVEPQESEGKG